MNRVEPGSRASCAAFLRVRFRYTLYMCMHMRSERCEIMFRVLVPGRDDLARRSIECRVYCCTVRGRCAVCVYRYAYVVVVVVVRRVVRCCVVRQVEAVVAGGSMVGPLQRVHLVHSGSHLQGTWLRASVIRTLGYFGAVG